MVETVTPMCKAISDATADVIASWLLWPDIFAICARKSSYFFILCAQ
jgi:hypothetical protein